MTILPLKMMIWGEGDLGRRWRQLQNNRGTLVHVRAGPQWPDKPKLLREHQAADRAFDQGL